MLTRARARSCVQFIHRLVTKMMFCIQACEELSVHILEKQQKIAQTHSLELYCAIHPEEKAQSNCLGQMFGLPL